MSLSTLPDWLLGAVLGCLGTRDVCAARGACKPWRNGRPLWRQIKTKCAVFAQVTSLCVPGYVRQLECATKEHKFAHASMFHSVERTDAFLARLVALTGLTDLNWHMDTLTDAGFVHVASLTNLVKLNLRYCKQLTGHGLTHIKSLSNVQQLCLAHCDQVSDVGLGHVARLSNLQQLDLAFCKQITNDGLVHLTKLPDLHELNLKACDQLTDAGLVHLGRMSSLQHLRLSHCESVTSAGLAHLTALINMRVLDLFHCTQVTDAGLVHIAALANLQQLGLGVISLCERRWDCASESSQPIEGLGFAKQQLADRRRARARGSGVELGEPELGMV